MKISVITVCYNNKDGLLKTVKSIINQTYQDLEFIIIDGGSTDGSVELIKEYQKKFSLTFITESDQGIYDAMNKGIKLSTGEWLNFMNSGDTFYKPDTIEEAAKSLTDTEDIIYGNTEIVYPDFKTIKNEPEPAKLWRGRIPHQSSFIKSSIMKKYGYNSTNKIVADLEFFMTVYYNGGHLKKINQTIASFAKTV
jgi:glycosyltransferase involved in cell wall biosynthesis